MRSEGRKAVRTPPDLKTRSRTYPANLAPFSAGLGPRRDRVVDSNHSAAVVHSPLAFVTGSAALRHAVVLDTALRGDRQESERSQGRSHPDHPGHDRYHTQRLVLALLGARVRRKRRRQRPRSYQGYTYATIEHGANYNYFLVQEMMKDRTHAVISSLQDWLEPGLVPVPSQAVLASVCKKCAPHRLRPGVSI